MTTPKYKMNLNSILSAAAAITLAALLFTPAPARGESAADYMFILKDGSTVAASTDEKLLSDAAVKVLKIMTAYGELEVPRDEIVKYYKSSVISSASPAAPSNEKAGDETKQGAKNAKNTVEKNVEPAPATPVSSGQAGEKSAAADEKPEHKPEPAQVAGKAAETEKKPDTTEVQDSVMKIEEIEEGVITGDKGPKPKADADGLLNLDDDKLLDMLGESGAKPPEPVISSDEKKIEEIEEVRGKYQAKKSEKKKLIPDNLSSIETDIKEMAQSSTEEDWLVAKFTKEIQIEKTGTVPVEIVEVAGGKGDPKKGDDKKGKAAAPKKAKKGTGEVSLSDTDEVITSETIEAEIIGGGKLSEKIGKEFKKHKAQPTKKVSEKGHLKIEIEKHFSVKEEGPARETGEVKAEKSKK